jgi:hypothetical protein
MDFLGPCPFRISQPQVDTLMIRGGFRGNVKRQHLQDRHRHGAGAIISQSDHGTQLRLWRRLLLRVRHARWQCHDERRPAARFALHVNHPPRARPPDGDTCARCVLHDDDRRVGIEVIEPCDASEHRMSMRCCTRLNAARGSHPTMGTPYLLGGGACGRPSDVSGLALTVAGQPAEGSGQTFFRSGQTFFRSGQTFFRSGQTFFRSGQTFLRSGQAFLRSGQTFLRAGQPFLAPGSTFSGAGHARIVDFVCRK